MTVDGYFSKLGSLSRSLLLGRRTILQDLIRDPSSEIYPGDNQVLGPLTIPTFVVWVFLVHPVNQN